MSINFTLDNDGIQLINTTNTKSGSSMYYKQLVVVSGYLLEIDKNITSIGANEYNVKIKIFNKGNQITPSGSVVTVYDFIPDGFTLSSPFSYSSTPWYSTSRSNNSVSGSMNGELQRWALVPSNNVNASLASGPTPTADNTWSVEFNITGTGEYHVQDVFVTGLDPERVDGAGSVESIIIENYYKESTIFGTVMAGLAGILGILVLLV